MSKVIPCSKLEYTDEADDVDDEPTELLPPPAPEAKPPSIKKARSDAQKATTARMRVKLDERLKELVIIKQEAKATALLQQAEVKAIIKEKITAKLSTKKADEKMRLALLQAHESSEEEEEEYEPEPPVRKAQPKQSRTQYLPEPTPVYKRTTKQLPPYRPTQPSYDFPSVRFV